MRKLEWMVTVLLILFLFPAFYSKFNVGNPRSIFRFIIKDPAYDLSFTLALCGMVAILAVSLYSLRLKEHSPIVQLLNSNIEYIRHLKNQGLPYEEIAESFLSQLTTKRGVLYKLAKKRVMKYLAELG